MTERRKHAMMVAATSGVLAAEGAVMVADRLINAKNRRNWLLIALGVAGTIPLILRVVKNVKQTKRALAQAS